MTTTPAALPAITDEMVDSLSQTKPWVRLMSILGFISSAFLVLVGGFLIVAHLAGSFFGRGFRGTQFLVIGVLYVGLGVLHLVASLFLHRYASAIADMQLGETVSGMERALAAQRTFWRFIGIAALVMMVLYVVLIGVFVVFGVMAGMHRHY